MLIIGLLFGAIHIDSVQTLLAKRLTSYFSDQLKTHVHINRVSIRFIKSVVLEGFYVEDQHGDTLIYTDELNISINDLSTKNHSLVIGKLALLNGQFNLVQYHGENHDNLHFITEYFSSNDTSSKSQPWKIKVDDLILKNVGFRHNLVDDTSKSTGVNFSHLDIKNINGDFRNISTVNDSIFVDIHSLTLKDQSGFSLNDFSSDAKISSTEIRLRKLNIQTPFTNIHTDLTFRYDSFASFDEFTSRINWQSDFKKSIVSFTDIAFFAPELSGIDKSLKLDGDFHGSVNNFKGKNVTLQWGNYSKFHGNISMNGLPHIDETYIDITADEIKTNKKDVEWLPLPPFNEKQHVEVPQNLSSLGNVTFKGKFTGFFSDFVAYGNVSTAIGSLSSDLNLKYNKKSKTSDYSGHLAASHFDAGKITSIADLGKVTFSINVNGAGFKLDDVNAKLEGKIDQLEFKNYNYKNIVVDGQIAKKLFNGSLSVKEPNVDFDFRGSIDYRGKLPEFNFIANIGTAKLDTLNLFKTHDKTVLQTTIRTHFKGNRLDNIVGGIDVDNTNFTTGNKLFHINSISIIEDKINGIRNFDILSDNLDAHLKGEFQLAKIGDAFKEILPRYLPSVILPKKDFTVNQNFTYDITLKNLNVFTEMLLPSWYFAPNTTLTGHFNSMNNDLALDISTPWIRYKEFSIDDFDIHASSTNKTLFIESQANRISRNGNNFIVLPELSAKAENNHINYKLKLADIDTSGNRVSLQGSMDFFSAKHFNLKIDSTLLVIENEKWKLDNDNLVIFDTSGIRLSSFKFSKLNESIQLDGVIGKKETDRIGLHFSGFNLDHLNSLLSSGRKTVFGGIIGGDIFLTDIYNKFQLESDLKISNLSINNDTLGNASIISSYNGDQNVIFSNISILKGVAKIVDISGNYYISKENNNLDFNIRLNNVYLHPLEPYIDDVMKEVYGKISADLKLTGSVKKPVLNGTVDLNKMSLIINYLNTRYSFSSSVKVKENEFELDGLKLVDINNNEATAKGKIYHDFFTNFRFDVELQAKRFQVLNTTIKDNILYYGTANASGYAHFYGPIENMNMDISLSPDRGTKINIPLNTLEDLSSSGFITFIDRTIDTNHTITRNHVDLSGIRLNMNLDMNRNAEIKIIFDEKIGDVITGTGTGSLRLDINTSGTFNMFGTYTIDKGEYLFTLQNLINKKFNIDQGGKITWAGDPYEAIVDLSAVYVVHTSTLYNILQDTTYKRRVPVECRLTLTNKLMNPTINYEINVLGLDPTVESLLRTKLNSEQEINKQMFGLLMFNQFFPSSGAGQAGTRIDAGAGAGASASELLSNQFSNWLGQLSKVIDISVNYRAKDTYTPNELRVMFIKTFLNDRLTFEGSVGILGQQSYLDNNVVGDFYAEYKLSDDGRFRLKGFNRSNADDIIKYSQSPYSQGLGFFYRKDFNRFGDLFAKWRKKNKTDEVVKP